MNKPADHFLIYQLSDSELLFSIKTYLRILKWKIPDICFLEKIRNITICCRKKIYICEAKIKYKM